MAALNTTAFTARIAAANKSVELAQQCAAASPHPLGLPPIVIIFLVSIGVAVLSNLAYKYVTDQAMIRQVREDTKHLQESLKAQTDPQKKLEIQQQITSLSMKLMPQQFKPMLVTIVPFLLIFTFLNKLFTNVSIIPLPFMLFGKPWLGWFGTYLICTLVLMPIFKKVFKVAQ